MPLAYRGEALFVVRLLRMGGISFFQMGDDDAGADNHNGRKDKCTVFYLTVNKLGGRENELEVVQACPNIKSNDGSQQKQNVLDPTAHKYPSPNCCLLADSPDFGQLSPAARQ